MAILGRFIDKQTISRAGDDADGVSFTTLNHSLPATNPEIVLPVVRSIAAMGGNGANGLPRVLGLGGNASILTVGYAMASSPSVPTLMYDVYAAVLHSVVR